MDFFGYYTIDDPAKHPFMMFSTTHLLFIILIICCIYLGLKVSKDYPEEKIKKIDKQRENYYNFYTGKKWGNMENYDITLNSAFTGIDGAIKVIEDLVRNKYG